MYLLKIAYPQVPIKPASPAVRRVLLTNYTTEGREILRINLKKSHKEKCVSPDRNQA